MGYLLLLTAIAAGYAGMRAAWPAPRHWSATDPLRLSAAPAMGLGIASGLFFALRVVLELPPWAVIAALPAALLVLGAIAWKRAAAALPDPVRPDDDCPTWLWILFGLAAAMALCTYLMLSGAAPHGEWDAWSIWNLRARFLFRAQEFTSPFSPLMDWSHPDYPILLPGAIALLWHVSGSDSPGIPAAAGLCCLISAVAVPFSTIRLLRGSGLAALCAIVILGASTLVRNSASQYADVPLSAFIVIAVSLLVYGLADQSRERLSLAGQFTGPVLPAGVAAGFAAWTKNEGLLFWLALGAALLLCVRSREEWRARIRLMLPLAGGVLLIFMLVGHFKVHQAPPNDLLNASNMSLLGARMTNFARFGATFWAFVSEFLAFGNTKLPPIALFGIWFALVRFRPSLTTTHLLPLAIAAFQLAGYFLVYVAASKDLDWQLNTSLSRLLLHLWPLFVMGIFLISRNIFEKPAQRSRPSARSK